MDFDEWIGWELLRRVDEEGGLGVEVLIEAAPSEGGREFTATRLHSYLQHRSTPTCRTRSLTWRPPLPLGWRALPGLFCTCGLAPMPERSTAIDLARRLLTDAADTHGALSAKGIGHMMLTCDRDQPGGLTVKQAQKVLACVGVAIKAERQRRDAANKSLFNGAGCLVCGGPLVDPSAQGRGIGPSCYTIVLRALK